MLKIMCFVFYQRTSQIELLKFLLDQFTNKELLEEESARQFYTKWNQDILHQTNNNVLKFSVSEGWKPLCQYLDCPVPQQQFPRQ